MNTNGERTFVVALAAGLAVGGLWAAGPLTFDFQTASDRMFPRRTDAASGNLFDTSDGSFAGNSHLHCIQKVKDPGIDGKIASKVVTTFRNGEGLIRIDESVRDFFKGDPAEVASVAAGLTQEVCLPDDRGGTYVISFDSLNGGRQGLITGAFVTPESVDPATGMRRSGKEIRLRTVGDDSEWFPVTWEVVVPRGFNRLRVNMRKYHVGFFRFRNLTMTRDDAAGKDPVVLRQGAHGVADASFAIGEGQVGYVVWEWKHRSGFNPLPERKTRFELTLPKGFDLVALNFAREATIRRETLPDGRQCTTFVPSGRNVALTPVFSRRTQMGAVVRATGPAGTEGIGSLRAVTSDGAPYSTVAETRYFTIPKVLARAVPKRFSSGVMPIMDPFVGGEAALPFARTAADAGARWAVLNWRTGTTSWLAAWRRAGFTTLTATLWQLRDGYFVGLPEGRPEADRFRTDPQAFNAASLACPSAIYEERPFFLTNTVPWLKERLSGYDGVWANWEPYKYFGARACMCDTCRRKFAEYVGVSEEEMKMDWPKEVCPDGKWWKEVQAFRAREHGRLVRTVDKYVRLATGGEKSVGFMPGISWTQLASSWRELDNSPEMRHTEYAGSLKWIEPWGPYPRWDNVKPYFHREGDGFVENFISARDAREQVNRDYPLPNRPKLQAFPQGYQWGGIIQPEHLALELDCYLFNGWQSAVFYHSPGGYDARYWQALAEANERAAAYEDFVFDGERIDGEVGFAVDPADDKIVAYPCAALPHLEKASLVQHAAYRLEGKTIVAVLNFRERPVRVRALGRSVVVPPVRTTVLEFGRGCGEGN